MIRRKNAETNPFTNSGQPVQREVWVERRIEVSRLFSFWVMKQGVAPKANPSNFIMSAVMLR